MKNESLEDLVTENIVKKAYEKEMDKIAVNYGSVIKGIDRAKSGIGAALAVGGAGYLASQHPDRVRKGLESIKKTLSEIGKEFTGKKKEKDGRRVIGEDPKPTLLRGAGNKGVNTKAVKGLVDDSKYKDADAPGSGWGSTKQEITGE